MGDAVRERVYSSSMRKLLVLVLLAIAFVIVNNRRYAALKDFAPAFGFGTDERLPGTDLPGIDFVALARGQGCDAMRVSAPEALQEALAAALAASVPTLVEVEVA